MPRFTGTIANNQLLINVFVAKNLPNHKSTLFKGLIDTGAMSTAISSNVASSLSLDPVGKTTMNSASHIISVNVYQLLMGFLLQKTMCLLQ